MTTKPTKWDLDVVKDILWYKNNRGRIPAAPFSICSGVTVVDRDKFLANIDGDIEAGPAGPRAHTGAIQSDLIALRRIVEKLGS